MRDALDAPPECGASTSSPLARQGVLYAAAAYGMWGFFPVYYKLLEHAPAFEVLLHRALWAAPATALIILARGDWRSVVAAWSRKRTRAVLALTSALIAANWLIFIWAVQSERVLEISLGYYIGPLLSVAMGVVVLGERLNRAQMGAVALAAAGVVTMTAFVGQPPWPALALAVTFGLYGLLRKKAAAASAPGLFLETMMLVPFCIAGVVWLEASGAGHLASAGAWTTVLLVLAGPVTAAPLLLFALAARRLKLATLGLMQYIAPTLQFMVAVAYGETFTPAHAATFALIWAGLAVFTVDALARERQAARRER